MLYRRPKPIKIWPTYAVPPTTMLYPRSTYDLWRAGHPRPFFNQLKNWSRSPQPLRVGPTNLRCIFDKHTLSPIKARSLPIRPFFPERERAGVDRLSGVNGPLSYIRTRQPTNPRPMPTNFYGLVGYDWVQNYPLWSKSNTRCIRAVSLMYPCPNPALPDQPSSFRLTNPRSVRPTPDLFQIKVRPLRSIYTAKSATYVYYT